MSSGLEQWSLSLGYHSEIESSGGRMIALDYKLIVPIVVLFFAYLGCRRGISKELLSLVGVLVATALAKGQTAFLSGWVNRLYRIGMFAVKGGLSASDPGKVMAEISKLAPPISTPEQEKLLVVVSFVVLLAVFYLLGEDKVGQPQDLMQRVLGLFVGGLNGFLIGRFLFPRLFPGEKTHITILSKQVSQYLDSEKALTWAVVVFCLIMIIYGVQSSSSPRRRQ